MKNDSLTWLLVGAVGCSAIASLVVLLFCYVPADRELRALQGQAFMMNNRRMGLTALINDAAEYSKKNAAILPILETVGVNPPKTAPAATPNKPASK